MQSWRLLITILPVSVKPSTTQRKQPVVDSTVYIIISLALLVVILAVLVVIMGFLYVCKSRVNNVGKLLHA